MNDQQIWIKLNEQLNAEYIDQLDKNFIRQNTIYFDSEFATIRQLDSGFAYPPQKNRRIIGKLDGLTPIGQKKYRDLDSHFKNR